MLAFAPSIAVLSLVQALLVAAPRPGPRGARGEAPAYAPAPLAALLERLRSGWWALALPVPIAAVVVAISLDPAAARFLTYLALVAVPPLAALAMGGLCRGGRPPLALAALPLFALAWAARGEPGGQAASLLLSALACVSLGWLLAALVDRRWLLAGLYAMAAIDAFLIGAELLQGPNATLNSATPAAGLPRLQFVSFGDAAMGFGDIFVAAVLGAVLARDRLLQLRGAALAAVLCLAFDLLFFVLDSLPATVPIALTAAILQLTGATRPPSRASQPRRHFRAAQR